MTMLSLYLPQLPLHSQLTKVQLNAGAAVPHPDSEAAE